MLHADRRREPWDELGEGKLGARLGTAEVSYYMPHVRDVSRFYRALQCAEAAYPLINLEALGGFGLVLLVCDPVVEMPRGDPEAAGILWITLPAVVDLPATKLNAQRSRSGPTKVSEPHKGIIRHRASESDLSHGFGELTCGELHPPHPIPDSRVMSGTYA